MNCCCLQLSHSKSHHHFGPGGLLLVQFSVNAALEAAEYGSSAWASDAYVGDLNRLPGDRLWPSSSPGY